MHKLLKINELLYLCITHHSVFARSDMLDIEELECVFKMWLQLYTNDLFSFLFLNQAGICGTCWLSTAAQVDKSPPPV